MSKKTIKTALASAFAVLGLSIPASAVAAPVLEVSSSHIPTEVPVPQGTYAKYTLRVSNSGTSETEGPITVDFELPAGVEIVKVEDPLGELLTEIFGEPAPIWECTTSVDATSVGCDGLNPTGNLFGIPIPIEPGEEACTATIGEACPIILTLKAEPEATLGPVHPAAEACGGNDPTCDTAADDPFEIVPYEFHITAFDGQVLQENGDPSTQAGSRPYRAGTQFSLTTYIHAHGETLPTEELKNGTAHLPAGFVGNVQRIAATCTQRQLKFFHVECPTESQVGTVTVNFVGFSPGPSKVGVYNMEVPGGLPALFGFNILGNVVEVYGSVRTGDDYGVDVQAHNTTQTLAIKGVEFDFWGVPADPSHDAERHCSGELEGNTGCSTAASLDPFLSLPTSCQGPGPSNSVETFLDVTSWQGGSDSASFLSHDNTLPTPNPIGNDGCNAVPFEPTLEARPTTNVADSASGLDVDLHLPQHEACDPGPPVSCETAEAHLRDTTVTLPQGMAVNPSGANGLGSCSEAQFGYTSTDPDGTIHTTPVPATCPDAAKLGTVQVDTPLLESPLNGAVYIATPHANPFGSLLAIYLAVDNPKTGIVVKLAGEVKADPVTGQLTTTFQRSPQQPFEDFELHFFGGAGGSLRTPAVCGTYSTTSVLTPWTAPEGNNATPSDAWSIEQAPGGGACPTAQGQLANAPDIDAGSISPVAGRSTPTVVTLRRADGTQEFSSVSLTLPPGLTGKLAGISQCSDAALAAAASKSGSEEKANPACPANSRIGTVDVAAGAGPAPYNTQGAAYLTAPYKGAPLGMAIITPAVAGPFDLGTVVVRVALRLDPATGQITAISDEIPHILQGIPLDVRSARVLLDRPDFTRNGTSCDPSAFAGALTSTLGQLASLSERFQLGECTALSFKPKVSIRLKGGTRRGAHPALTGIATMPAGGANIARASVALPRSEFLDQGHIGTVCTRVQFAADACPAASIYGTARATSPLVDYQLEGPVYLRSSDHELPDLVAALQGPASQPIEVDVSARIDSVKGGIRSSFEAVPDLPVSTFTLEMQGGKKGLLQNSTNICKRVNRATAELDGQNGKLADLRPALKNSKCKGAKRAKRRKRAR